MACYPRDGFCAMAHTFASGPPNRHKEPNQRNAGKWGVSYQAVSGVLDLGAGLATHGANRRLGSLQLQREARSTANIRDDGVARKDDLIEIAGCELLRKQVC